MSKASASTKFRVVDVDALENQFEDEQGEDVGSSGPDEGEVNSLLASKKNCDALKIVLADPPLQTKNKAAKDKAFQLVMRVLNATKANEIEQAIKGLDNRGVDILMKYIYRGFSEPSDNNCAILLSWHEKATAIGGLGCIVRVLADRKTV
ncbi:actin-related protein 2/3 complex subunit 5-C [Exaiptasia diaphana]|uniref:Actin-related protein 2/3 complex subunit 5 n=1 Tax=Exaiptasia diaphana TaxID=2652724 RepID=A0A913XMZ9_EXADI|nr:actin-related protein 2/3 complex subunit 5-C [Exaiptasia diaphana]KXJ29584.1 Actin-related protein 2/3 complex subunit 5 [Exaiptasia diaphana]